MDKNRLIEFVKNHPDTEKVRMHQLTEYNLYLIENKFTDNNLEVFSLSVYETSEETDLWVKVFEKDDIINYMSPESLDENLMATILKELKYKE